MEEDGQSESNRLEREKIHIEYMKHLTTLSTGSIILITTFLEKLFVTPLWKPILITSIMGFMVSILSSVADYTIAVEVDIYRKASEQSAVPLLLKLVARPLAWLGFLTGTLGLAVFAIRNLIK